MELETIISMQLRPDHLLQLPHLDTSSVPALMQCGYVCQANFHLDCFSNCTHFTSSQICNVI